MWVDLYELKVQDQEIFYSFIFITNHRGNYKGYKFSFFIYRRPWPWSLWSGEEISCISAICVWRFSASADLKRVWIGAMTDGPSEMALKRVFKSMLWTRFLIGQYLLGFYPYNGIWLAENAICQALIGKPSSLNWISF